MTPYEYYGKGFKLYFIRATAGPYMREYRKTHKTPMWTLRKDDSRGLAHLLGIVKWHGPWRGFTFFPENNTVWAPGCLEFVAKFITHVKKMRAKRLANENKYQ